MNKWSILGMFFVSDTHSLPASDGNSFVSQSLDVILTEVWKTQQPWHYPKQPIRSLKFDKNVGYTQACHKEVEKSSILWRQIVETKEKGNHLPGLKILQPNHALVYYFIVQVYIK